MIHWIHIKNFRSLRDSRIEFSSPVTAIIGPNNSGKSSLLLALQLIGSLASVDIARLFSGANAISLTLTAGATEPMEFALAMSAFHDQNTSVTYEYGLQIISETSVAIRILGEQLVEIKNGERKTLLSRVPGVEHWSLLDETSGKVEDFLYGSATVQGIIQLNDRVRNRGIVEFRELLSKWWYFDFQPSLMKTASPLAPDPVLAPNGSNLAAVLDNLKNEHPANYRNYEHDLRRIIPEIEDLKLRLIQGGSKYISFTEKNILGEINSLQVSDGVLRACAFLAAVHAPKQPYLLMFEEPENGLHPARLELVVEILRDYARQSWKGVPRQVIITTHAPALMNWLRPEEVQLSEKTPQGVRIAPISDLSIVGRMLEESALGEIWSRGSIGGVPTS